jgi:hypothetical protein
LFGFSSLRGGNPGLEEVIKRSTARWADSEIFANVPISEFLGPGLSEVILGMHFWEPYTHPLKTSMVMLNKIRDSGWPLPLFIGNELMGNGASLFTIRAIDEHWESIPSRVIKARVQVTLREYGTLLSSNALTNLVGQALSLL